MEIQATLFLSLASFLQCVGLLNSTESSTINTPVKNVTHPQHNHIIYAQSIRVIEWSQGNKTRTETKTMLGVKVEHETNEVAKGLSATSDHIAKFTTGNPPSSNGMTGTRPRLTTTRMSVTRTTKRLTTHSPNSIKYIKTITTKTPLVTSVEARPTSTPIPVQHPNSGEILLGIVIIMATVMFSLVMLIFTCRNYPHVVLGK